MKEYVIYAVNTDKIVTISGVDLGLAIKFPFVLLGVV